MGGIQANHQIAASAQFGVVLFVIFFERHCMDYEKLAESMNEARKARGEEELPLAELIVSLKKSARKISTGEMTEIEARALERFRELENEKALKETPIFIKLIWGMILSGVIYFIFS